MCGTVSKVYGLNSNQTANQINVGDYPEDWGCQGTIRMHTPSFTPFYFILFYFNFDFLSL